MGQTDVVSIAGWKVANEHGMHRFTPRGLCEALVEGVKIQKRWDNGGVGLLAEGCHFGSLCHVDQGGTVERGEIAVPTGEEEEENKYLADDIAWDDVNGSALDPEMVRAARMEEIPFYWRMGGTCESAVGGMFLENWSPPPVGVKWVDHNKVDRERPNYRSRMVGQDFNDGTDACALLLSSKH